MGPWRAREWKLDPDSGELKKCGDQGQPGTAEFRTGLRDALQQSKDVVGAQGVFSLNERDHNGTDRRAQALVKVENGKWVLVTAAKWAEGGRIRPAGEAHGHVPEGECAP